jgi:hypothetical protein
MSNADSGPYEEGKIAASDGEKLKSNPYEKGTDEFDLWREGFKSHDDEEDEGGGDFEE